MAARFPETRTTLATLPGIGRSTAAAIASLCFGERVASILDANVKRVVTRVLGFDGDLGRSPPTSAHLWDAATNELLPSPGLQAHHHAALHPGHDGFGATVCTPKKPACLLVPRAERAVLPASCRGRP